MNPVNKNVGGTYIIEAVGPHTWSINRERNHPCSLDLDDSYVEAKITSLDRINFGMVSKGARLPYPGIEKIIFNYPATIVFFKDGTKEVVKLNDEDVFDARAGVMIALLKRAYGNKFIDDLTAFDNNELPVKWEQKEPTSSFDWTLGVDIAINNAFDIFADTINNAFGVKKSE